jgi:hypothetical protein
MAEERQGRIPNVQDFVQSILSAVTNLQHSSQTREENASQGGSVQQFTSLLEELNIVSEYHVLRIRVYQIMRLCRSQPFRDTEFYTHDYLFLSPYIFYMPSYKL